MRAAGLATAISTIYWRTEGEIDNACISASVPGVPFEYLIVAVVFNGRSPAREVEVIILALGAARIG